MMDNYQMVVGNKDCPLKAIVSIVRKSPVIQEGWSTFARELDVPSAQIKSLRQDLLLNKITREDLIVEMLEIWMGKNGSKATLANLLQVVEGHCGANDVGELLRLEYKLPCKDADGNFSIEWKDLSPAFQKRVIETFQHFTPNLIFKEVLPKLTGTALVNLMRGKKPHILSLPEELSYYVSRTIVTRNIISPKIFDQNSSDIFLFSGMDRYELSVLAKDKLTGSSRQELHSASNVKFIILEQLSHFEKICGKTNHPVHFLKREGSGKFRWVKSKGGMGNLRKYIDQEQDEVDEGQLCKICDSQSIPVLICDTPGMGKSVLLAQIGHRLVQLYPDRIVLFIELSEFNKLAKSFGMEDKLKMIELTLQNSTGGTFSRSKMNFDEETVLIELLLDGFDEVDSEDRKLVLEILQAITNSFKCIRMWITSRPHLMDQLENNLSILGYNIRPFHEENQIRFLSSFWSQNVELDQEKVQLFAKHCLKSFKATMNSTDNDIAGIPLQCLLIGEVYEDDAVEFAKVSEENDSSAPPQIEIGTITNLYRQLVKMKFEKYKSASGNVKLSEKEMMTVHSHLSLEVLFPHEHESLRLAKACEIDMDEVMKGGILTSSRVGVVRFMHRTFAEYFVAWFILDKLQQAEEWMPELVDLFFKVIDCLKLKNLTTFTYPVICYFLNSMISDLQMESLPDHFSSELDDRLLKLGERIALACLEENFAQIFNLFNSRGIFDKLSGKFFNAELLLLAIRNSSVGLVNFVLTHFERHHNFDLEARKVTLREAVKKGRFSILEFLIKEKRLRGIVENCDENTNLVCDCVAETIHSSGGQITEKILVIRMLVGINGSLVNGQTGSSVATPLLSDQVHVELLIELIRLGANVLVQNPIGDTILHISRLYCYHEIISTTKTIPLHLSEIREDYHKLLVSIPTNHLKKLVHMKDSNSDTALMTLLRNFDPLPETLDIFHDVGADFNHVNDVGESVAAVALQNSRNEETIQKLYDLGVRVRSRSQVRSICDVISGFETADKAESVNGPVENLGA